MHVRQIIRDFFKLALLNKTDALDQVFLSRVFPVASKKTPSILIYTKDEIAVNATLGDPGSSLRELSVTIEIYSKNVSNPDSIIDDVAAQIEIILGEDCQPIPEILEIEYSAFQVDYNGEGENAFLVGTMLYVCTYSVLKNDPERGV